MKYILIIIPLFIACQANRENRNNLEQYVEIQYTGEDSFGHTRLVVSKLPVDKLSILKNDPYYIEEDTVVQDTFWIKNVVVDPELFELLVDHVKTSFSRGDREEKEEVDSEESPIVTYKFTLVTENELDFSDVYSTNDRCKAYFESLIEKLENHESSKDLIRVIHENYLIKLEYPGWGNVRSRMKQK